MKRFEAFQGLRAIAFLLVFISHCNGLLELPIGGHGAIGVEIFFVLSGFLVEYHHREIKDASILRQAITYSRKKLSKFFWLHILTMLLMLAPTLLGIMTDGISVENGALLLGKIAANLLLLQSWIPDSTIYFSLNGVAWYLSTSMFLYFVSPWLHRVVEKIGEMKRKLGVICLIFTAQLMVAYLLRSSSFMHALVYVHPLTRSMDFLLGMLLASIRKASKTSVVPDWKRSIPELAGLGALVFAIVSFCALPEAISYVTLSVPAALLLVYSLSYETGFLSKVLSMRVFSFLGNISFEMFLIHKVIIVYWAYVQWLARKFFGGNIPGVPSVIFIFLLTVTGGFILSKVKVIKSLHVEEVSHVSK